MNDLLDQLAGIKNEALSMLVVVKSAEDLKLYKARFIGRQGSVTELLKKLGTLEPAKRPEVGKKINELKKEIEEKVSQLESSLTLVKIKSALKEQIDVTLPGRFISPGKLHPVTQVMGEIWDIFRGLGFSIYEGPEIETDYYNFEALNVPANHPARDMQDTFYIKSQITNPKSELLLRTHTSPMQIRMMKKFKPPINMIFPGAVYRRDADVSHSPMFHQVEGLMVGEKVTMANLRGVLTAFVHKMLGDSIGVRFRPSFFPFTEPSAEVDIECVMCRGKGCRVCKQSGWLEILGSGMVHPNVFENVGYDPSRVTGFAFGMGVERIAMLKFGVSDIRMFFENDVRFLEQF